MAKINVRMEYFLDKQSRQMKVIFAIIKLLMIYIFKKCVFYQEKRGNRMIFSGRSKKQMTWGTMLSCAVFFWMTAPLTGTGQVTAAGVSTKDVYVRATAAEEEAKFNSQQVSIITAKDIEQKQAKTVEDIIFTQTGVSRTVDSMGRVGVSIRGAEPRHTLILIDGQAVMGDLAKYSGQMDEVMRIGTENVDHIEVIQGAASAKYGSDAIGGVINIITKKAAKKPQIIFNAGGMRTNGMSGMAPYSTYFLRADSGQIGKARVGVYMSKRDVMPAYAHRPPRNIYQAIEGQNLSLFDKNSLRFFGNTNNVGVTAAYKINKDHSLQVKSDHYVEDLKRTLKHTNNEDEPQQIFRRKATRNMENVTWNGRKGNTDWTVEVNHAKINEDDVALINFSGRSQYEGKNELKYIDDIDHKQTDWKISANTQINDKHLLSYGFGYSLEKGEGSRLKGAPKTTVKKIDPWDYDKELLVEGRDAYSRQAGQAGDVIWSHVHRYKFIEDNTKVMPEWDYKYEYYGTKHDDPTSAQPLITYEEYSKYKLKDKEGSPYYNNLQDQGVSDEVYNTKYKPFRQRLEKENPGFKGSNIVGKYFEYGLSSNPVEQAAAPKLNGKRFLEEYNKRSNSVKMGWGTIKKYNFFLQDTIQADENTIFMPIIRLDHSSLFGSHVSGNLGMTYQVNHNPHRRFKVNVGTAYTEPGMGELWYHWEMFGSNPIGVGAAKMGWYWKGNPSLKPETAVNIDAGIEGESKNTYARVGVFYNRISNYMTVKYSGKFMDFAPFLSKSEKWKQAPDLIYTFDNIGRVDITGIEAEVKRYFTPTLSLKLGWTYLHPVNKSDPSSPIVDKPKHKIDISLNYDNKKSGWSGQLWGNYYVDMYDSHTLANKGNYWIGDVDPDSAIYKKAEYQKKTYGIWNVMVQKSINADAKIYFGINNIFDHHDDDRALQSRVFRWGLNVKFGGTAAKVHKKVVRKSLQKVKLQDFIERPEGADTSAIVFNGMYQMRWNSNGGINRAVPPFRKNGMTAENALRNTKDLSEHGFEQRIRFGISGTLGRDTHITVSGSATAENRPDSKYNVAANRGLTKIKLDKADITKTIKKWDVSVGRLQENMGVTGYLFGREFDGVRTVWTHNRTQIRAGYGYFAHSTGVNDSAYTHLEYGEFYRVPTVSEFMGLNRDEWGIGEDTKKLAGANPALHSKEDNTYTPGEAGSPDDIYKRYYAQRVKNGEKINVYFYQQLRDINADSALSAADKRSKTKELLLRFNTIVNQSYGKELAGRTVNLEPKLASLVYSIRNKKTGAEYYVKTGSDDLVGDGTVKIPIFGKDVDALLREPKQWLQQHKENVYDACEQYSKALLQGNLQEYIKGNYTLGSLGKVQKKEGNQYKDISENVKKESLADYEINTIEYGADLLDRILARKFTPPTEKDDKYDAMLTEFESAYIEEVEGALRNLDAGSKAPRSKFEKAIGKPLLSKGLIVQKDEIPVINGGAFLQIKRQVTDRLGVQAWYFRSLHDHQEMVTTAKQPKRILEHKTDEHGIGYIFDATPDLPTEQQQETRAFSTIANIIGIGAKWQMGPDVSLSLDYGRNYTDYGRFMNGSSIFEHTKGTADFRVLGRNIGSTPSFRVVRLDIGRSDASQEGSWNFFADYKSFGHGAFFGGTGAEGVPDRYLDGISSFTVGAGYVPKKDLLLQGYFTFDAKGTRQRDTIYGAEHFTLGDYSRIQLTYKF